MKLILPCSTYKRSYHEYIRELGDEERHPFPLDFDYSDFPKLLMRLENFRNGVDLPEGFVPASTYWLVKDKELIGVSNLRHGLNDWLRQIGGHIGLGIRPSCRGKGLGNLLLSLTVEKAIEKGIREVHVYCYKDNQASARMIRSNGGELESEIEVTGQIIQRFVINKIY